MVRVGFRAAAGLLAVLLVPVTLLAAALPASAASGHLCESFGNYCLGSDNLDLFTAVVEKPKSTGGGRNLIETPLGGEFDGFPTYLLQFSSDTTKCVASSNSTFGVVIHPCNGGTGVVWARETTNGHLRWINVYASSLDGTVYLAGANTGSQYGMYPAGDGYEAFDWQ